MELEIEAKFLNINKTRLRASGAIWLFFYDCRFSKFKQIANMIPPITVAMIAIIISLATPLSLCFVLLLPIIDCFILLLLPMLVLIIIS